MRFGRRFSAIVGGVIRNEGIVQRRRIRLLFGVSGRIASTRRYILLWLLVARCMGYCFHRNSQNILTSSLSIIGAMHTGRYVTACDSQELGKKSFLDDVKRSGVSSSDSCAVARADGTSLRHTFSFFSTGNRRFNFDSKPGAESGRFALNGSS